MCVAVRKKLQLFYWKDRKFHELQVQYLLFLFIKFRYCSSLITILLFILKYNFWFESVIDLKVVLILYSENIFKNNLRDLVL